MKCGARMAGALATGYMLGTDQEDEACPNDRVAGRRGRSLGARPRSPARAPSCSASHRVRPPQRRGPREAPRRREGRHYGSRRPALVVPNRLSRFERRASRDRRPTAGGATPPGRRGWQRRREDAEPEPPPPLPPARRRRAGQGRGGPGPQGSRRRERREREDDVRRTRNRLRRPTRPTTRRRRTRTSRTRKLRTRPRPRLRPRSVVRHLPSGPRTAGRPPLSEPRPAVRSEGKGRVANPAARVGKSAAARSGAK